MDFTLTDEQLAVSEAANGVFSGLADPVRVRAVEQGETRIDRDLWRALADADLLGLAVPEAEGGAGHGLVELGLLLQAQGAVVAPVPLWATLVLGALPIASSGTDAQRARWLPGVVSGDTVLSAALTGTAASPTSTPPVSATPAAAGWVLTGTELAVPQAHLAARIVVPAHAPVKHYRSAVVHERTTHASSATYPAPAAPRIRQRFKTIPTGLWTSTSVARLRRSTSRKGEPTPVINHLTHRLV